MQKDVRAKVRGPSNIERLGKYFVGRMRMVHKDVWQAPMEVIDGYG